MSTSTTAIEWCTRTWNPVRGCSRVSEGCRHCYAERLARRFSGPGKPFEGFVRTQANGEPQWTGKMELIEKALAEPLSWKKPARVFVNSMSDLFHENLSFEEITAIYAVMHAASQHTYQVLTKRPERRLEWSRWIEARGGLCPFIRSMTFERKDEPEIAAVRLPFGATARTEVYRGKTIRSADDPWVQVFGAAGVWRNGPLRNVWEGTSVESPEHKDRIDYLRATPAAVRFLSLEPLLEDLGTLDLDGIHWVIAGGESGPGARPCDVAWVRSIVEQCKAAGTACFVKQLGANPWCKTVHHYGPGVDVPPCNMRSHPKDRKGGDIAEFPEDLRVREFPAVHGG